MPPCCSPAANRASARKRPRKVSSSRYCCLSSLTATGRPRSRSVAFQTSPIPPTARRSSSTYRLFRTSGAVMSAHRLDHSQRDRRRELRTGRPTLPLGDDGEGDLRVLLRGEPDEPVLVDPGPT